MPCIPFKTGFKPTKKNYELYIRAGIPNGRIIKTPDYTFEMFVKEMSETRSVWFMCGDFDDIEICTECSYLADILCDYPVGDGKTCDRVICEDCAHEIANDLHYCSAHYSMWREFVESDGVRSHLKNVIAFKHEKG